MQKQNVGEAHLGGFRAWWIWALAVTFVVYLFNIQTGYAIVNPKVQADVGLTLEQVSIVAAVYTWVFAVCQFFGGALLDKLGARRILIPAIALVTLGVGVFSIADSFGMLLLSQFILAIGSCVGFVGAGYVGGQWFGMAKYGIMFGWVQTVASLSSALGQSGISLALHETTWRHLAYAAIGIGVILLVLNVLWMRNPKPVAKVSGGLLRGVVHNLFDMAKIPHIWNVTTWGAIAFGTQLSLGVIWAPKILIAHGMEPGTADFGSAMVWLGLAVGCLFWNPWSEHIRGRKIPAITGIALQLVALSAILWLPPLGVLASLALMFLCGLGSSGHMIAFSSAGDVVPGEEVGASAAFVNGFMFIMGGVLTALPSYLLGSLNTAAAYRIAFVPYIVLLALALCFAIFQRESFPKLVKSQ